MKAEELLRRYRQGDRNFAGANLRGQSFKGQDLSGADFSGADIRGANFSDATLIGTNFCRVEAGLQRQWVVILTLLSFLLVGVAGYLALFNGALVANIFNTKLQESSMGWASLLVEIAVFVILLYKGILFAFAFAVGIAVSFGGAFVFAFAVGVSAGGVFAVGVAFAFAVGVAFAFAVGGVFAVYGAFAAAIGGAFVVGRAFTDTYDGLISGAVAFAIAEAVTWVVVFAAISILISTYIGWRALKGDPKYALIKSATLTLAALGGTSFRKANLTDANLNQACCKSTDLRQAILIRTSLLHTRELDRLRPCISFLNNPTVRTLVQTGHGQGIDLTHLNLRGINLADAQLEDACFRAADLSEATLVGANLTRANLVQTQLNQTDLTGATLTGATIEDWGITGDTNLQGVCCDYIYMRWVKESDPDPNPRRKPDNYEETFANGEFSDFIKPIVDTLDLYHNQNVDSRAIAIAFKQLAENNPDANLEIVAMEKRGQDKVLLKAKTTEQANHSQLSQQYFSDYNHIRSLSHQETQRLMVEKDDRIRSLENFVNTALKRPSFYAETYQQRGDLMSENSGVNINTRDGNVSGVVGGDNSGVINLGEILGDIHNTIQQLPSNPTQSNLKALLRQLQTAIADEPELNNTEKAAALAQVKKLAEAGQAPQDSQMKQLATKATGFLKGITGSLTAGAKLVTAWEKVGPAILAIFGLL